MRIPLILFLSLIITMTTTVNAQDLNKYDRAIFAGGCFWCIEAAFEKLEAVSEAISGYIDGQTDKPSYEQVGLGNTGHTEAVEVYYDASKISYAELLDVFWKNIDPTDSGGQFADRGSQYRTAIFYLSDEQKNIALKSKKMLEESKLFDKAITTEIKAASTFYPAEDYHQNYHQNNKSQYQSYHFFSGRGKFIQDVWDKYGDKLKTSNGEKETAQLKTKNYSKPSDAEIKGKLNDLQYKVTQKNATEAAFQNEYWDNKKPGIYVDVVSGEPLFSSTAKFDSGTGWPSFTKPLVEANIVSKTDISHFMVRTEAKSKEAGSHLGHIFDDGPEPNTKRYCINSAALKFIPADKLNEEGYSEFEYLFQGKENK